MSKPRIESKTKIVRATTTTVASTKIVYVDTSRRFGHATFFNSATVFRKNLVTVFPDFFVAIVFPTFNGFLDVLLPDGKTYNTF